jgi:hypothetical protein
VVAPDTDDAGRAARLEAFGDAAAAVASADPPAALETQSASCWISLVEREPVQDGIPPPPEAICAATVALDGLRSSRLGSAVPEDPDALRVWQPPHPACAQRPGRLPPRLWPGERRG